MPFYRLYYHLVWATRDRLPMLEGEVRDEVYGLIRAKVIAMNGIFHAIGGMPDHLHVVVTVPPTLAIAMLVGQIKGASSHQATRLTSARHAEPFGWQAEYGVVSFAEAQLRDVVNYVVHQPERHASGKINRTLEALGDPGQPPSRGIARR